MKIPRIQVEETPTTTHTAPTKQMPENQLLQSSDSFPQYYTDGIAVAKLIDEDNCVIVAIQRKENGYEKYFETKQNIKNISLMYSKTWTPCTEITFKNLLRDYANTIQKILEQLSKEPHSDSIF